MTLYRTLGDLDKQLRETKQLAADAHVWSTLDWNLINIPPGSSPFSRKHKELVTQIAFFQSFLDWEQFLEESFILYMLGHQAPKGNPPTCYATPPDRATAEKMVAEGKSYADWAVVDVVIKRADRFFDAGKPYSDVLKGKQATLEEIKTIRNALAHSSQNSKEKFKRLVRRELGRFPPNLTIGGFLGMTIPHTSTKLRNVKYPVSFLEFYIDTFLWLGREIVPI